MTTKRGALGGSVSPLPIDVQLMSMRLAWNIRQAGGTRLPQITARSPDDPRERVECAHRAEPAVNQQQNFIA
jgi:hypothetical protein